jgi:SAM-dependent methyltransferase
VPGEPDPPYEGVYAGFDSPVMRRVRAEASAEDIGQHSWVTAEQLRADMGWLRLTPALRLLDLGCGACGPLTFVLRAVGCRGTGLERSAPAVALGRDRAAALEVAGRATIEEADLDHPLPVGNGAFDAAMSLDVVLHLRDRAALFREVARSLVPGGRFLFTDAGVLAGPISGEEAAARSVHGHTVFVPPGFNERALDASGFRLLEKEDRTGALLESAEGRRAARLAHRGALEEAESPDGFERQQRYLDTVIELARRRSVSRVMYLAESHGR